MQEVMQLQESVLDGLIEDGNDECPASDNSDSRRDWDVSQPDDCEFSTERSLLSVSQSFRSSAPNEPSDNSSVDELRY